MRVATSLLRAPSRLTPSLSRCLKAPPAPYARPRQEEIREMVRSVATEHGAASDGALGDLALKFEVRVSCSLCAPLRSATD